jgi:hypothetical protein
MKDSSEVRQVRRIIESKFIVKSVLCRPEWRQKTQKMIIIIMIITKVRVRVRIIVLLISQTFQSRVIQDKIWTKPNQIPSS